MNVSTLLMRLHTLAIDTVMHNKATRTHCHLTGTVEIVVRVHVPAMLVGLLEKQGTAARILMHLMPSSVVVRAQSLEMAFVTSFSSIWMMI
jgi:hypothetical protein